MRLTNTNSRRRGSVTVIVVAFLALLLVLGLSFAFYALRESEESRVYRDSVNGGATGVTPVNRGSSGTDAPPEPEAIANGVFGTVIYDAPDDITGAFNGLRNWSMARTIYGWNPKYPSPYYGYNGPVPIPGVPAPDPTHAATQPFNGYGYLQPQTFYPTLPPGTINWVWMGPGQPLLDRDNNYARDPHIPLIPWSYNPAVTGGAGTDRYVAANADYTYPDPNNLFLAAIDPKTGRVLVQSYHRPWLIGTNPPPNAPTGPNSVPPTPVAGDPNPWTNQTGRFVMLRPRPVDNQWPPQSGFSEFPYPTMNADGTYGDVELLTGKPGGLQYDAQWLDPDMPVRTWRGKNYKPLVAMLIVDQDGRVNLNTAGNYYPLVLQAGQQPQYVHGSDQGIGPWEVNPSKVLLGYPDPMNPTTPVQVNGDAAALSVGTSNPLLAAASGHGRYGLSWLNVGGTPQPIWAPIRQASVSPFNGDPSTMASPMQTQQYGQNIPPGGSPAHFYGGVDFSGRMLAPYKIGPGQQFGMNDQFGHFTNFTWGPPFIPIPSMPTFPGEPNPASRFGDGYYISAGAGQPPVYDERSDHPSLFNPYLVRSRAYTDATMKAAASTPGQVVPNRTFGVEELRYMNAQFNYSIPPANSHLARLAFNTLGNPAYRINQLNARFATTVLSNDIDLPGAGPTTITAYGAAYQPGLPQQGQPLSRPTGSGTAANPVNPAAATEEFDDSFRSRLTSLLGPVDINRKLTEYRFRTDYPLGYDFGAGANPRFNVADNTVLVGGMTQFQRAIADRQRLAADIFARLCRVTGIYTGPVGAPFAGTPGNPAQRWLAQLAVNIVDFIDGDDCITPFRWTDPTGLGGGGTIAVPPNDQVASLGQFNGAIKNDWVFGFERSRVNINEAYLRIENDPQDPFPVNAAGKKAASKPYDMRMWLELHNPVTPASPNEQLMGMEGYNNLLTDDNTHGGYRASLKNGSANGTVYRVLLYKVNGAPGAGGPDPLGMRPAGGDNVAGLPGPNIQPLQSPTGQALALTFDKATSNGAVVDDSGGTVIQPNLGAQYRDASFYLVGPQLDQQMGAGAAQVPDAKANLTSTQLQAKVQFTEFVAPPAGGNPIMLWSPGFVIQRLACPALPPGPLNPYVTLDYFESDPIAVYNRLKYDDQGNTFNGMSPGTEPDWNTTYSWGRRQPYDAVIKYTDAQHYQQKPGQGAAMGHINFTFGQHNGNNQMPEITPNAQWNPGQTLQNPLTPLVHYDRVALNSTELLQVVAVKPHELTHSYYESSAGNAAVPSSGLDPNNRLWYTADWMDHAGNLNPVFTNGGFLYRALGALKVATALDGLGMGGRVPGKININTIYAPEILDAIVDAQQTVGLNGPNRFQTNSSNLTMNTQDAWGKLLGARQGIPAPGIGTQVAIGPNDKPFVGAATVIDALNGDRLRTAMRPDMLWPMSPLMGTRSTEAYSPGAAPTGHAGALEKYEMLSKAYNQLTTRSNTFAVYMMIGYFEVKNPGPYTEVNRPILGKELGTDDGTVTRHKFFAVIDRTNLTIEAPNPALPLPNPGQPVTIKQGQAPVFFPYQPDVAQPSAANNFTIFPDPPTMVQPPAPVPVTIRIPAIGNAMNPVNGTPIPLTAVGEYDGTPWMISVNAAYPQGQLLPPQLYIDVGNRQEQLTIAPNGVGFDPLTNTAVLQVLMPGNVQHSRGAIIRLANPDPTQPQCMPGNPGPQPGFNYKSPRYASVVKYVEQLK
jgi:hypothetical protein